MRVLALFLILLFAAELPAPPAAAQTMSPIVERWLAKAKAGDLQKMVWVGTSYKTGRRAPQSYAEALKWFRRAAARGYAAAQYNIGAMYHFGQGVIQNYDEAINWYRKAARQGYPSAQTWLGKMYDSGQGVKQDYGEASKWFRRAAEAGDFIAKLELGYRYRDGRKVSKDLVEAYMWYFVADRKNVMEDLAKEMTAAQIAQAKRRGEKWQRKHKNP